jgi:hypothetical protein
MPGGWIKDWATFLQVQFVTPINRLYDLGATVVVLTFGLIRFQVVNCLLHPVIGYVWLVQGSHLYLRVTLHHPHADNYAYTPLAKAPTQRLRTTKIPKVAWDQRHELQSTIPENYMVFIMWQPNPHQSFAHITAAQFAWFTWLSVFSSF